MDPSLPLSHLALELLLLLVPLERRLLGQELEVHLRFFSSREERERERKRKAKVDRMERDRMLLFCSFTRSLVLSLFPLSLCLAHQGSEGKGGDAGARRTRSPPGRVRSRTRKRERGGGV